MSVEIPTIKLFVQLLADELPVRSIFHFFKGSLKHRGCQQCLNCSLLLKKYRQCDTFLDICAVVRKRERLIVPGGTFLFLFGKLYMVKSHRAIFLPFLLVRNLSLCA